MKKHAVLIRRKENGTVLILVVIAMVMLLGMVALAIDVSHMVVAKNELKNAADAGALAAAQNLYNDNGMSINTNANQIGVDAATANKSENLPVEVALADVERGHWSFGLGSLQRGFTPNDSTAPTELWNVSTAELDQNTNFINAVRVTTHRKATPVASYFAKIFGKQGFVMASRSVAYIGFAGKLRPQDVDQPIAICAESLTDPTGEKYTCNIGRMINSGSNPGTHNTAGWTNFTQPCQTANASGLRKLICKNGNPDPIDLGKAIGATGGADQSVFKDLMDCWKTMAGDPPIVAWEMTLPVIKCPGNNVSNCSETNGAVTLNVIWINGQGTPKWADAPRSMTAPDAEGNTVTWTNTSPDGETRWNSFVSFFKLKNVDGQNAPYAQKSIYFLPDCKPHPPLGRTGGENFGILAQIPVLVE